ncbi:MAG: 1-deoxy-D-xylulose-5-phosphate synthase [Paramuribaculum sp.]|nr:1-deoxy-D-xylulose-5-phosphate synthase [Paramuribaculum sp.]
MSKHPNDNTAATVTAQPRPLDPKTYPLLSRISTPAMLRKLPMDKLLELCEELRRFLIDNLSVNPGHFASSMGAVELTVALHYVFSAPDDRIVWDVGHQAYSHKLLTGRAPLFYSNRTLGGLSGFPNPAESEYDSFSAGHASNSISAALGMAVASQLKGEENPRRNVVAVIGDASISGGLAFEGINNAAISNSNLLIVLNDNDMSIDRNVGSLNSYLVNLNTSKSYNNLRMRTYNFMKRLKLINESNRGRILRFNNSLKSLISKEQNIFEGLNIRYFGPFDGHDLPRIIRVLTDIKDMKGPRLLHLRTIKGKGYEPAEKEPAKWHAPGKFDPQTGKRMSSASASASSLKWQDIFGTTLVELARKNSEIVAVTAAMPSGTSVNMMAEAFPDRTFDVGIAEGHAVTFSAGLAKEGLLPFAAIYSSFLQRAYDSIIHDVAIQNLRVTLCIDRAGLVGEDGVTHHGVYDIAYLRNIPGFTVSAPRNATWLRRLMLTASMRESGPWAIRYPRGNAPASDSPEEPLSELQPALTGKGELLRAAANPESKGVTLLTLGPIALNAAKAADIVSSKGIDCAHYDMVFAAPIDEEILLKAAQLGRPIITVEDGIVEGGMGSAVAEWISSRGLPLKVIRLGIPRKFISHGSVAQLQTLCGLDAESIAATIEKVAQFPTKISLS